jgi:ketosteroid isomerase-like protein
MCSCADAPTRHPAPVVTVPMRLPGFTVSMTLSRVVTGLKIGRNVFPKHRVDKEKAHFCECVSNQTVQIVPGPQTDKKTRTSRAHENLQLIHTHTCTA